MATGRRSETMEANRVKLIAAARKAFAEKGFAAASMDELTADAGLTRGALYHNFGDKQGARNAPGPNQATALNGCSRREKPISNWRSTPKCSASCCWTDQRSSAIPRNGQARMPVWK
jgi:hypothetical protein